MHRIHLGRLWLPVVAAVAIAAGGTAVASPGAGHERTISLREATAAPHPAFVDLGAAGPSAGDQAVLRDGLLADGAPSGTLRQACTLVDPGANPFTSTYECETSLELAGGTITASGPFLPTQPEQSAAITGGTGAFRSARGEVVIRAEADEFLVRLR